MSKELKIRAWHPDFQEMIYSSQNWLFEKREFYPLCMEVGFSDYPTDGWVLMEWVGWKDKIGNDIYDGDIYDDGYGNLFTIEWVQDHCQFLALHPDEPQEIRPWGTVVGNIHQNPELLQSL